MTHSLSSYSVLIVMVALSIIGIATIGMLNIQYMPETEERSITVTYSMGTASAEIVESEATALIEGVLSGTSRCCRTRSVSTRGGGSVIARFSKGTDMTAARFDVASAIRNISGSLPKGMTYPEISMGAGGKITTVLVYNIRSELPSREIERYVTSYIMTPISSIKGVASVRLAGVTPYEVEIEFDADKASLHGISADDIASAFKDSFDDHVLGMTQVGDRLITVRMSGTSKEDFGAIPIKNCNGMMVFLRDIACWHYQEALPESYYRINGLNTINMAVSVTTNSNIISTADTIKEEMLRLQESFPPEISVGIDYDASEYMSSELEKIYLRTGFCLLILLLFVFFFSRSWRYVLIAIITIAVNLLSAVVIYNIVGLQVHIYTLAGITVSLGIIIDTSIMMIDHYSRFHNKKAFGSLVCAVATTIVAVLPVMLLPEEERLNLTDFIWVIAINLVLSLVVSYFFAPALIDYIPVEYGKGGQRLVGFRCRAKLQRIYRDYIDWGVKHRWMYVFIIVAMFGIPTCLLPNAKEYDSKEDLSILDNILKRMVTWGPYRDNRETVDNVLGTSFALFNKVLNRSNFYREPEKAVLYISAGMLEGSSVHQLNEVIKSMENYLAGFKEISTFRTEVNDYDDARIAVEFKPEYEHTATPIEIKGLVTGMAVNFGGANWSISGLDNNYFSNHVVLDRKSYGIELHGYNYRQLLKFGEVLVNKLSENKRVIGPEIRGGNGDRPSTEFNMKYDFEKLAAYGISPYEYYSAIESKLFERSVGSVVLEGAPTPVMLRSSARDEYDLWHALNDPVAADSTLISLRNVGGIEKRRTGIDIVKDNQSYEINVMFDVIGNYEITKQIVSEAVDYMNGFVLPVGYKAEGLGGARNYGQKSNYAWLILLIILAIYVMLCIAFESMKYPLAVISMIPVSFVGVLLTFGFSRLSFDQGGFAAFVMLCGITVNAGIYLVHASRKTNIKHRNVIDIRAYLSAFKQKIAPILLTVLSTVLGLLPFLIDGPTEVFWFDFAIGTVSGLIMSIIAVIFVLPIFVCT